MSKKPISFGKISLNINKTVEKPPEDASTSGFGTFGRTPIVPIPDPKEINDLSDDLENQQLEQAIGVKNFGKKAKNIDIDEMVLQAKKAAEEASKRRLESTSNTEQPEDDSDLIGPPLPLNFSSTEEKKQEIGPPVLAEQKSSKKSRKDGENQSDEDSYDELSGSDDEDVSLDKRIPYTHEVSKNIVIKLTADLVDENFILDTVNKAERV